MLLKYLTCMVAALVIATSARAETGGIFLSLDDVLVSAQQHYPKIVESLAKRSVAAGKVGVAEGAFDLVFGAEGFDRFDGFYDGRVLKSTVEQPLRPLSARLFSEYKVSDGTFPIYEDEYYTNTGGTLSAGVLFSLLRDRDTDPRRFAEVDAGLELENAELELLMVRIGVQQRATVAYWRWVVAGAELGVYEELLDIAQQRESGLEKEVASGARASIFLTENEQNIIRRQSLVTSARRSFANAANALALYYRNSNGALQVPSVDLLPPAHVVFSNRDSRAKRTLEQLPRALANRPEIRMLENAITRTDELIVLRENELRPRLDMKFELATGFGEVAEGGPSRDSTDAIVGFNFTVPLQQRTAKARLSQSIAERNAIYQQQRQRQDEIEIEVRKIFNALVYAEELAALAGSEVELAETMRLAEQKRFKEGASDFFLVNVREEAAASARVSYLSASLETLVARVNFDAATLNLSGLGLPASEF